MDMFSSTQTPSKEQRKPVFVPFVILIVAGFLILGWGIYAFMTETIITNDKTFLYICIGFGGTLIIVGSIMIDYERKRIKRLNLK